MLSSVKAYVFDLGNVIVDIHIDRFLPTLGLDGVLSDNEALRKYQQSGISREFELGRIPFDDFHRKSCNLLGAELNKDLFLKAWNEMIGNEKPGMAEIISACSGKAPVYLLSNTNDPHYHAALEKAPSLMFMKDHFLSYKLNLLKPDPQIYIEMLNRIGLPARDVFFTDDLQNNIATAEEIGLHTLHFASSEQLKHYLLHVID
jgi:glucose-1-phosphatase